MREALLSERLEEQVDGLLDAEAYKQVVAEQ